MKLQSFVTNQIVIRFLEEKSPLEDPDTVEASIEDEETQEMDPFGGSL